MPMSDKVLRAINKGRRESGLKPIRRKKTSTKKGTTKGEVRKTARRAYEPKKSSGFSPRAISKRIQKEKGSAFTYQEMLNFYKNEFKTNSVPELRYKERQIARYERLIKKSR